MFEGIGVKTSVVVTIKYDDKELQFLLINDDNGYLITPSSMQKIENFEMDVDYASNLPDIFKKLWGDIGEP